MVDSTRAAASRAADIEELARLSGMRAEHVLLESRDTRESSAEARRTALSVLELRNPRQTAETRLTLFADGHLGIETRSGEALPEQAAAELDLRYLDPRPLREWRSGKALLRAAWSLTCIPGALAVVAYALPMPVDGLALAATALVTAPTMLAWSFVTRLERHVTFRTLHGRAPALVVVGNFGCLRQLRALSRELMDAVHEVQRGADRESEDWLRAEIREHYRLAEADMLSADARTKAVRRVLSHFD